MTRSPGSRLSRLWPLGGGAVVLLLLDRVVAPYLDPTLAGVGHDHGYYLPRLLEGYYWYLANGALAIPWWTPSLCGGIPNFPDPQSTWFSLPQWLVLAGLPPLDAIRASYLGYVALGGSGCYALLRRLAAAPAWAFTAAAIFAGNGFVLHHTLIGHAVWMPALLVPLTAWALLRPRTGSGIDPVAIAIAALTVTAMFYGGMVDGLLPALLAILCLVLVGLAREPAAMPTVAWHALAAGALTAGLCLAKLLPALAYLAQFPRDAYPVTGFASLSDALLTWFRVLFVTNGPGIDGLDALIVNNRFETEPHELEFHLSPLLPPLLLLGGALQALRWRHLATPGHGTVRLLLVTAIAVCLALPLALNVYSPTTAALVKQLPVVRNSADLLRWWLCYVPVLPVLAALWTDRAWPWPRLAAPAAGLLVLGSLANLATQDRTYYAEQPYDPRPVHAAFAAARAAGHGPAVTRIAVEWDRHDRPHFTTARNDALIFGASSLWCYEAMLGYRLEQFPQGALRPGPALAAVGRSLNVKNPACYVYPAENGCAPGDHFDVAELPAARAFLERRPIPFERPALHRVAPWLSAGCLGICVALLGRGRRRKRAGRGPPASGYG